ncbi:MULTISPECIES: DUF3224 domain-containing protein [unclassified Rhodanobacter]|uniref:DUF3224 domain-containing protein n=1 Tax=unclassified Rhodanobacter TaxID=2621553 RepID=UPI002032D574|nr:MULTISPECIES: DUF3224 domain-containing protein [unclassified Rhodanobacter]
MKAMTPLLSALAVSTLAASAPTATPAPTFTESTAMHATGHFDVKVAPQTPDNPQARASGLARLSLDKQFHGDLDAVSQGEMLAAGDGTTSGAYVALEKVSGKLHGRSGSFVLVHRALMVGGAPQEWTVAVVPDSGTGELAGLGGAMTITIADGKHGYDLAYTLPGR